jgi:hypothetical protein
VLVADSYARFFDTNRSDSVSPLSAAVLSSTGTRGSWMLRDRSVEGEG